LTIPHLAQDVFLLVSKIPGIQTDLKLSELTKIKKIDEVCKKQYFFFSFSAGFEGILRTMVLIAIFFYERYFTLVCTNCFIAFC